MGRRFALTYVAIAAICFTIYAFPFELFGAQEDWLTGYLAAYAKLAGLLLSVVDSLNLTDFIRHPEIDLRVGILATGFLMLAGALAGYFPARRAAKVNPIHALRDQ